MAMTPEDLVLFAHAPDPAVKACQDALHTRRVLYRGSASLVVAAARQLIQTKKATAEKEQAQLLGFETLLTVLEHVSPTKTIAVHHFSGEGALFSVAFETGEIQPLGGIGVWHTPAVRPANSAGSMAAGPGQRNTPPSIGKN